MRILCWSIAITGMLAACGGNDAGNGGVQQCDNPMIIPAPAACNTACDPAPGALATCPGGFHCSEDGMCDAVCTPAGNECGDGNRCTPDGRCVGNDECVGLECNVVKCEDMGMPPTTIEGTVFAPNGTLPLFNINVYIPNQLIGPPADGLVCDKCGESPPGYPLALQTTDAAGHFSLTGVPSGMNVPLIIQSGKWRRQITIPNVAACGTTTLTAADTSLPKNKTLGYMPKIALTTGNADSLECLVRKLGIDDSEITTNAGDGRVNFYHGNGVSKFAAGFAGGTGNLPDATAFWSSVDNLKKYDIVFLSCEGGQNPDKKPQAALDAMKAYADAGGRVFASHWHNIWIEGATDAGNDGQKPANWTSIGMWNNDGTTFTTPSDQIDEANNPKGANFATWMLNVMGSTTRDVIAIQDSTGKNTLTSVDHNKAEEWVYWPSTVHGQPRAPQTFQFTTPQETPGDRCGKVVFTDMHVSGTSSGGDYPNSCGSGTTLTPQEKALAFMFFDIASCVAPPIF
ncbi:hypothetical protein BH11MYX2_BH11MYX2_32610 [soil metagenome]